MYTSVVTKKKTLQQTAMYAHDGVSLSVSQNWSNTV